MAVLGRGGGRCDTAALQQSEVLEIQQVPASLWGDEKEPEKLSRPKI